jgi:uncharacterized protein HemY
VSFSTITIYVASQRVFVVVVVVVYFVIDTVRKLLDTPTYSQRFSTCGGPHQAGCDVRRSLCLTKHNATKTYGIVKV